MSNGLWAKRLNLQEFIDSGALLEVNRSFFHPISLALVVEFGDGEPKLKIIDLRDMEGGPVFGGFSKEEYEKIARFEKLADAAHDAREAVRGFVIEPIEGAFRKGG